MTPLANVATPRALKPNPSPSGYHVIDQFSVQQSDQLSDRPMRICLLWRLYRYVDGYHLREDGRLDS